MSDIAPHLTWTRHATRTDWLKDRPTGIGCSELAAILGRDPYKTPLSVWRSKVQPDLDDDGPKPWRFRRGHHMESLLADWYEETTGRAVADPGPYTIVRRSDYPLLYATVDRLIEAPERDGYGVLEIKTANAFRKSEWDDGAPLGYRFQLQGQMYVTLSEWGSVVADYGAEEPAYWDYDALPNFDRVRRAIDRFWKYVEDQEPPPAMAQDTGLIKEMYPEEEKGLTIHLPEMVEAWAIQLDSLEEQQKAGAARIDALKNGIALAMENAETGVLPSGRRVTYKTTNRKSYTVEAAKYRVLRLAKD